MAHVELSLTEPNLVDGVLGRWAAAVAAAQEACLLLDDEGVVVAASESCLALLGTGTAAGKLFVDVVRLVDFTANSTELSEWEVDKVPPLFALSSGGLARGLLRVAGAGTRTLDAVAAPVRDGEAVVGSLSFFALVSH